MHQPTALPRDIAGIRLPDSALAQKAVDLAFRVSPDVLRTHVVRTFVFELTSCGFQTRCSRREPQSLKGSIHSE